MTLTFLRDFNKRNHFANTTLCKQGYQYHEKRKSFSILYHRHSELVSKYNIVFKTLLQQEISELVFYADLVYKFEMIAKR